MDGRREGCALGGREVVRSNDAGKRRSRFSMPFKVLITTFPVFDRLQTRLFIQHCDAMTAGGRLMKNRSPWLES